MNMDYLEEPIVAKCKSCGKVTPKKKKTSKTIHQVMEDTAKAVEETLEDFSDEVLVDDEEPSEEKVKEAKGILERFSNYIKSDMFKIDVNDMARKYNVPPKKIAESYFEKVLGTIGDVAGVVVETSRSVGHTLIDTLATIAHGAVNVICNVANALVSVFTLNKTCMA